MQLTPVDKQGTQNGLWTELLTLIVSGTAGSNAVFLLSALWDPIYALLQAGNTVLRVLGSFGVTGWCQNAPARSCSRQAFLFGPTHAGMQ